MLLSLAFIQGGLMGFITNQVYPVTEDPVMFFLWVIANSILLTAYGVAKAAEKE
jgi:hypothetical protein